jgi:hypothetical protein
MMDRNACSIARPWKKNFVSSVRQIFNDFAVVFVFPVTETPEGNEVLLEKFFEFLKLSPTCLVVAKSQYLHAVRDLASIEISSPV